MDDQLRELVWRGVTAANPWWTTRVVPPQRSESFRRHAFGAVYDALRSADPGRGVVLLGPRRVGKTVLLHQIVEQLLADGVEPARVCLLSLDDVALRDRDLGELLEIVETRQGAAGSRILLLDEVQHSAQWAGWLKRIADRRDPYTFLATGSSATALAHGGQDAGVGRWREITLFPWSFREHVQLSPAFSSDETFSSIDTALAEARAGEHRLVYAGLTPRQTARINSALVDYLLRGGFPEAARADDLVEARRRLRQDILDRSLGRDIIDATAAEPRVLERMFLRICLQPGGLWNSSEVARDIGVSRPMVSRYLGILERSFLVFRLPNLGSPIKGLPKVYLVAPSLRQALLGMDGPQLEVPEEWGRMAENAMASALVGTRPNATSIGFWRRGNVECDGVVMDPVFSELVEVKRSGRKAVGGIEAAGRALKVDGLGSVLCHDAQAAVTLVGDSDTLAAGGTMIVRMTFAEWLYQQDAAAGGTIRIRGG